MNYSIFLRSSTKHEMCCSRTLESIGIALLGRFAVGRAAQSGVGFSHLTSSTGSAEVSSARWIRTLWPSQTGGGGNRRSAGRRGTSLRRDCDHCSGPGGVAVPCAVAAVCVRAPADWSWRRTNRQAAASCRVACGWGTFAALGSDDGCTPYYSLSIPIVRTLDVLLVLAVRRC